MSFMWMHSLSGGQSLIGAPFSIFCLTYGSEIDPRYAALWVENPFSHTSARTTYRLGEDNFHTGPEEEGIFSHNMFLTSWRTFWCHSELFDVMICFDIMTNLLKSWRGFDVITNFWRHEMFLTLWQNVDIILTFSRHDVLLTSWETLLTS